VLGGNIGTPLIERAPSLTADDWAVLELSELQLPTIERGADVAVYTNIGEDHLDRHGTVEAYRAVKARLGELTVASGGQVVLNADDPGCLDLGRRLDGDLHWYGLHATDLQATADDEWVNVAGERLLRVAEVPLPGRHLLADVLGAALGAHLVGVPGPAISDAVRRFRGVPHRLELISERDGVRWVNDSQATIPAAAIAALAAFDAPIVLIAGGKDKGVGFEGFADGIAARCRAAVLIGETADELERLIDGRVPVKRATSMDDAVRAAAALAEPGDVVVMSPAAASFDMFVDYAARGDAFRAAVAALEAGT
jgi:UDP-N-acetylmuramoylalanine--D-glutamate ligase